MSTTEDKLKEITDAIAAEGRARSEARTACLKAVKKAADENNSGTAKAFAEAYDKLRDAPPTFGNPFTQMPGQIGGIGSSMMFGGEGNPHGR